MPAVFQVQAKDSVIALNAYPTVNAVQNFNVDPSFNEENFSELGNANFSGQARSPEVAGSFEITSTGSLPSVLARMIFNYTTQRYKYDPTLEGNNYSINELDFENAIFDIINLKKPGETFQEALLIPNCTLSGLTLRVDASGSATETYSYEGDTLQAFATPYHDMLTVPLDTTGATTGTIDTGDFPGVNSGTYQVYQVHKDDEIFDSSVSSFTGNTTLTVTGAGFTTSAPFDRVSAVLFKRTPGTFPTIHYPTAARFVRGDRADIWLVNSGTTVTDANRLLRCQSVDVTVDLTRDRLQQILRNTTQNTTYFRGLNFPLNITVTVSLLETTLAQWAALQGKTLNPSATADSIDTNNVMDLSSYENQKLEVRYYKANSETAICTVTLDNLEITTFSESQQVQGRAERSVGFLGSEIQITGA